MWYLQLFWDDNTYNKTYLKLLFDLSIFLFFTISIVPEKLRAMWRLDLINYTDLNLIHLKGRISRFLYFRTL